MRIIALICAYWPERFDNVARIVSDLNNGSVKPDRILVLNNHGAQHQLNFPGAEVVNSQFNSRTRGKFAAALLDVADYYLLLDDDTSVGRLTVEKFKAHAHPNCCWGYLGTSLAGGNGHRIYPRGIEVETPCQFFLGCGLFLSFRSMVRTLAAEERVRLRGNSAEWEDAWAHCGEDILVGLANPASVLPLRGEEEFLDLAWGSQAMAHGSDGMSGGSIDYLYYRDRFTRHAMNAMGLKA